MNIDKDEFIKRFNRFTERSVEWSVRESEEDINNITNTLKLVMEDVERRSQMSKETFKLLGGLQERFNEVIEKRQDSIRKVVKELTDLGNDHREMDELVRPLIYSLQFQDRMRQMLENSVKISKYWHEKRQDFTAGPMDSDELRELGEKLLKLTICFEERNIIRKHIKGLPEEERPVASTIMF